MVLLLGVLLPGPVAAGPLPAGAPADHGGAVVTGRGSFRDCPECPEMVVIPAGRFEMGSPDHEQGRFDSESPRHPVTLRWFALARRDVTVEEFAAFVRETGYDPGACDWPQGAGWNSPGFLPADPVVCVSWRDAQAYIQWLNRKLRERAAHPAGGANGPYRLPSEAEWEYAARAGTTTARWWGDGLGSGRANCNGCGSRWDNQRLAPAGSFAPNPFGLYDMLGNVWQWTEDCWNENHAGAPADGRPRLDGDCRRRVLRGGSWSSLPEFVRSAARSSDDAASRTSDYAAFAGFRPAMTLP